MNPTVNKKAIVEVLKVFNEWVDPNAFVGGGAALSFHRNDDRAGDVDIWFTSTFRPQDIGCFIKKVVETHLPGVSCGNPFEACYKYAGMDTWPAGQFYFRGLQFQAIHVKKAIDDEWPSNFRTRVFSMWDLPVCKFGLYRCPIDGPLRVVWDAQGHKDAAEGVLTVDLDKIEKDRLPKVLGMRIPKYLRKYPHWKVRLKTQGVTLDAIQTSAWKDHCKKKKGLFQGDNDIPF